MTKILLVEDDKSLREIYGVRLLAEGYDIVSAGDGEEALAMAIKEKPTLIVSDVMMPKISGFDMLDILRSTTETRDIKVIMMTALSSDDQRARGEQLGADRYLVKSQVGIEDVVRTVHEVLEDSNVAAPGAAPAPQAQPVAPTDDDSTPQAAEELASEPVSSEPATPAQPVSTLPQPTAPFSSPRPATLGERVINPLDSAEPTVSSSVKSQIEQELQAPTEVTATQVDESPVEPTATPSLASADPVASVTPSADDDSDEDEDEGHPLPPQPTTIS